MNERFSVVAVSLADFPDKGKLGTVAGARELILHENYRLVYQTERDTVWTLTLAHVTKMWPHSKTEPTSDTLHVADSKKPRNSLNYGAFYRWRENRDLNPRNCCQFNGFRIRPVRPLRHLPKRRES